MSSVPSKICLSHPALRFLDNVAAFLSKVCRSVRNGFVNDARKNERSNSPVNVTHLFWIFALVYASESFCLFVGARVRDWYMVQSLGLNSDSCSRIFEEMFY